MMKIIWTKFAITELRAIYNYYKTHAGISVAQHIKSDIFETTNKLRRFPQIGQVEQYLIELKNEYRYLLAGNYKVIYYIQNKHIYIVDVFDCRRNPIKLKEHTEN